MDAKLLPLALASDRFSEGPAREPLDRLRMQKGIFLLERRGPSEWRDLYLYRPYDWGPYSRQLTAAVGQLVSDELLDVQSIPHRQYGSYRTTEAGEVLVDEFALDLPLEQMEFVGNVRRYVTSRSFSQLLREVYAEFPEFATKSRFAG